MLRALPRHAMVEATLAEARRELGLGQEELDSEDALASTEGSQLALLIAGVAVARALTAESVVPRFVAGMSVGAFAAAVAAGALDFPAALALVRMRARLMAAAYPRGHGMAAIIGLNEKTVETLLGEISTPTHPAYLANVNAPDQMVISGSDEALERALASARRHGARRTLRLAVPVPSHSPFLDGQAAALATIAANIPMQPARVAYLENRSARATLDPARIRADLAGNMAGTVRWHDMMTNAFERGARVFVEMPPGDRLTELTQPLGREVRAFAVGGREIGPFASLVKSADR